MSAFLYEVVRTPRGAGKADGALAGIAPVDLLAALLVPRRERWSAALPEDFALGCVTQVGEQGANLARTAWLHAGMDKSVPGLTLNRFCCSGLDALGYALGRVLGGDVCAVAGGVESTSRVPMFSDRGSWFSDAAVRASTGFVPMGVAADLLARRHGYARDALDSWALQSHQRAARSPEHPFLQALVDATGALVLERDEMVRPSLTLERLAALPAVFGEQAAECGPWLKDWYQGEWQAVHSVANAPAPADGAALALLGNLELGERIGRVPLARVLDVVSVAGEPVPMLEEGPAAVRKLLARHGLSPSDIDLYEFNESFAATTLHFRDSLGIPDERLNIAGGALARGHALGATGVMLVADLLANLRQHGGRYGVAAICGGAGVATACLLEVL